MDALRIAFIGCGPAGAANVGAWSARMPQHCSASVYVKDEDGIRRATSRVTAASAALGAPLNPRITFTTDKVVSPGTNIAIVQLPRHLTEQALTIKDREVVVNEYIGGLPREAIKLHYTAAFVEPRSTDPLSREGYIHFKNPAHLLPVVEVGLPCEDNAVHELVRTLLASTGFYPIIRRTWPDGFFSNRFQLRLLIAAQGILRGGGTRDELVPGRIDYVVAVVIKTLQKVFAATPHGPVFANLRKKVEPVLDRFTQYKPLWDAFVTTWQELLPTSSDNEIAIALLGGVGLRWINPGFLRFTDFEGITEFSMLIDRVFPGEPTDVLEHLMEQGRTGGAGHGDYPPYGFFIWDAKRRAAVIQQRDAFLLANRVNLGT